MLGLSFLRSYYTIWDQQNSQLGFYPTAESSVTYIDVSTGITGISI
jgi:hypothetical protein